MRFANKSFAVLLMFIVFGGSTSVFAQADFYKGKTVTVYIGTTPGALYDQWGRILAQHMGKHIPGRPDLIVQNMPGAEVPTSGYIALTAGAI